MNDKLTKNDQNYNFEEKKTHRREKNLQMFAVSINPPVATKHSILTTKPNSEQLRVCLFRYLSIYLSNSISAKLNI